MRFLLRLLREQEAATAVEYAVMLGLILAVALVAIGALGSQSGGMWGNIEGDLRNVGFFGP
jgi:pilus assembly protein Flp/PilA